MFRLKLILENGNHVAFTSTAECCVQEYVFEHISSLVNAGEIYIYIVRDNLNN